MIDTIVIWIEENVLLIAVVVILGLIWYFKFHRPKVQQAQQQIQQPATTQEQMDAAFQDQLPMGDTEEKKQVLYDEHLRLTKTKEDIETRIAIIKKEYKLLNE